MVGSLRLSVVRGDPSMPGDQADVGITLSVNDVRCLPAALPLACSQENAAGYMDYAGSLQALLFLTITDRYNLPAPAGRDSGTTQEIRHEIDVDCLPTGSDPDIGSTCSVQTTADALVPGTIAEGRRANIQLGQIEVFDTGEDGRPGTGGLSYPFLRQGVFVP
jgi:hypothetical protein